MADRLGLYNGALLKLGQARLVALSDEGNGRRALDDCYDRVVRRCLEGGMWNFAMRFAQVEATPSASTEFGYRYVFDKPDDWLRTAGVTYDGHGASPILAYDDRGSTWLADVSVMYVRYVSIDEEYGMDLGRWPAFFTNYVEFEMAAEVCEEITGSSEKMERMERRRDKAKARASNIDAMNEPVSRRAPSGRLVAARRG